MDKIKTKNLLLSGDSWMANPCRWADQIFQAQATVNLAVPGAGNGFISHSVIDHVITVGRPDFVFVNWTGLNRVDIALPRNLSPGFLDNEAKNRQTTWARYHTNHSAPWRDRSHRIPVDEPLVRMMYQEKDYRTVKSLSLIHVINLQDFLKVRRIPYLFCFIYDYTNADLDHNHLTNETEDSFSGLGSLPVADPMLAQLDTQYILRPTGMEWAMSQSEDLFKDQIHLKTEGLLAWADEMLKYYQQELTESKGVL